MAAPKVYIEPTQKLKPKHNSDDYHELLQMQIFKEVQNLKRQSRKLKDQMVNNQHLVIFIHGFNNSEEQIHKRAGYLDSTLGTDKVITTAFNWQSCCSLWRYRSDRKSATKVAKYFALYLQEIRNDDIHVFKQIDIICHSMGNHILTQSILHCYQNNKLDIFSKSNIIAVAADADKHIYKEAATHLVNPNKPIVSKWIHLWNDSDLALYASSANDLKWRHSSFTPSVRAGLCDIDIKNEYFDSIPWTKEKFWSDLIYNQGHGYIGDIFHKSEGIRDELFKLLGIDTKISDDDQQVTKSEMMQYSEKWSQMYCNVETKYINRRGVNTDSWWMDVALCEKYYAICGTIRLQKHKGGTKGIVGLARSKGWWSNHNHEFRIIWRYKQNAKWKELYHSDDLNAIQQIYNEYIDVMKWKQSTFQNDEYTGHRIIYQESLFKQSLHLKKMRKRWMVLTSDHELLSYKSETNALTPTEIIDLSLCKEIKSDQYYDESNSKFPFTLYFNDNTQRLFGADSSDVRDIWVKHLSNSIYESK